MAWKLEETSGVGKIPIWQKVLETVRGGLTLDLSAVRGRSAGAVIKAGTPMTFDEGTRLAGIAAVSGDISAGFSNSTAKGYLYEDIVIPESGGTQELSVVTRGTLYVKRVDGDILPEMSAHLAKTPLVIGSQSY